MRERADLSRIHVIDGVTFVRLYINSPIALISTKPISARTIQFSNLAILSPPPSPIIQFHDANL
jgi:hypothetical protein